MFDSVPASTRSLPFQPVVQGRDLLDPGLERLGRHVVAEPVRGRVVGDREVFPAAPHGLLGHLLQRLAAVTQRRVAVQVAAQVAQLDQLRQRAVGGGLELPAALAQLGRDPRVAQPLVDLLLGRALQRRAVLVAQDPVLAHVQPAPDRGLAQLHVVGLRAREVLQDVAELLRRDDPQVHLHARVRDHPRAGLARGGDALDQRQLGQCRDQRLDVARRGDDVDVLGRVPHPAHGPGDLHAVGGRMVAQRARDLLGHRDRARQQDARGGRRPPPARPARAAGSPPRACRARGSCGSAPPRPPRAVAPASRSRARRRAASPAWRRSPAGA